MRKFKPMNAKDLQAEIEEALLRGADIMIRDNDRVKGQGIEKDCELKVATVLAFCRERAANLAASLADRTHADARRANEVRPMSNNTRFARRSAK